MQDRPNFAELLESVRDFLQEEVSPTLTDHRTRFRTLVSINALTILGRELEQETRLVYEEAAALLELLGESRDVSDDLEALHARVHELNARLSARVRAGDVPDGALEHLLEVGAGKLRVASPAYLKRYET
ncbi:MAG: DUF6285 domain-containing protein [Actinomycetota bacterium]|nr:DUF6285 domain-containing protein [Actinomycetota bacterium]